MDSIIEIEGKQFVLVKEQRSGLSVYKDEKCYLRLGEPTLVKKNVWAHKEMQRLGFPVPGLVSAGLLKQEEYFIEESLGDKTFRTLFEEDIALAGSISDKRFSEFLHITGTFLGAQSLALVNPDPAAFARGVHLDVLREELPQYAISLNDKFQRVLLKLSSYPYVLSHGDFNPANLFPRGVIDLEDVFPAPFGFDAVSAISTVEWFPLSSDYEYFAHYRFNEARKQAYLTMCDAIAHEAGYPPISAYYDDFAFYRAIWSAVRMQSWPKLQSWRYEKFIKTYLFS